MMKKLIPLFWFAAIFLTIFSSKLWLIDLYGSALPWWDQWAMEGWCLYIPFLEGKLALKDLFVAHSEHRPFVNRVLALLILVINGQWDSRLGMVLNALITAGTGAVLSYMGWILVGRKNIAAICLFNTIIFSLPFSWECSLLGLVGNYLLIAFALLTIWLMLRPAPFTFLWLLGLLPALLSLVTMGSGFFAALAVTAVLLSRIITRQSRPWLNSAGIIILLPVITAGLLLRVNVSVQETYKATSIHNLLLSFAQQMAWPNTGFIGTAIIVWLPILMVLAWYIFRHDETVKVYDFVLGFGLWLALQEAVLALLRSGIVTSRHTTILSLSLPINFLALLLLFHDRTLPSLWRKILVVILLVWLGNVGYNLWKISDKAHLAEAAKGKRNLVQCEKNVRAFLQTDNIADLENKPLYHIPFPLPQALAMVLRNPHIRAIMPPCVAGANKPGPLSVCASKLIPKGDKLIFIGIGLLIILTGIRFYQSLGTFEKRLLGLRWTDFKQLLKYVFIVLAITVISFAGYRLYSLYLIDGLKVTYFRGINFEEKIRSQTEPAVCRDYTDKPPPWQVPNQKFSALWEGILRVPETDDYLFFSQSDDGLRLVIDGKKIIDNWRDQSWNNSATGARAHLLAGDHKIAIEYYNNEGDAGLRIKWCGGPVPPNTVLATPYLRKRK